MSKLLKFAAIIINLYAAFILFYSCFNLFRVGQEVGDFQIVSAKLFIYLILGILILFIVLSLFLGRYLFSLVALIIYPVLLLVDFSASYTSFGIVPKTYDFIRNVFIYLLPAFLILLTIKLDASKKTQLQIKKFFTNKAQLFLIGIFFILFALVSSGILRLPFIEPPDSNNEFALIAQRASVISLEMGILFLLFIILSLVLYLLSRKKE